MVVSNSVVLNNGNLQKFQDKNGIVKRGMISQGNKTAKLYFCLYAIGSERTLKSFQKRSSQRYNRLTLVTSHEQ